MRRQRRLLALLIWLFTAGFTFACIAPQVTANIWVYMYNNKHYPMVRWKKNKKKIKVYVNKKSVSKDDQAQFEKDAQDAMKEWNAKSSETGREFEQTTNPKEADVVMGEKDLSDMGDDHLGEATVGGGNNTTWAVVSIDDDGAMKGWEKPGDTPAQKEQKYNREKVMVHELGHVLGAGHSPTPPDNMVPKANPATDQDRTLTDNDVKEAKAASAISERRPLSPEQYNLIKEQPAEEKTNKSIAGDNMNLGHAVGVQVAALDPTCLIIDPTTITWSGNTINVYMSAAADAEMHEAFVVDILYDDGTTRQYGGIVYTNYDAPPVGFLPHAVVPNTHIVVEAGEEVFFNGYNSYHDSPDEMLWYSWNIDGVGACSDPYFSMEDIAPGIYHGTFSVFDRWGRSDTVELDIVVGVSEVWIEEPAYPVPGGVLSDIRIDSQDMPHIAHGSVETGQVLYSYLSDMGWEMEVVAQAAIDNQCVALDLTPLDQPQIVFYDATLHMPFFAERNGPGSWYVEPIPGIGGSDYGDLCDIATNDDGMPHVVFVDYNLQQVVYATYVPGLRGWVSEPVASVINNPWSEIDVNGLGNPVVVYRDGNDVHYAEKVGGVWQCELATDTADNDFADTIALSLDSQDIPTITYEAADGMITVGRRIGGDWFFESAVPSDCTQTMLSSTSFESAPPGICWYSLPGRSMLEVSYATKRAGDWTIEVYDADTGSLAVAGTSIDLDSKGNPWVSYMATDGAIYYLRVAHRKPLGKLLSAPTDTFNMGWNWFSLPWQPTISSEASDVLGFNARNRVFRWDPVLKTVMLYPDFFTNLAVGDGYCLWLDGPIDVSYWATPGTHEVALPLRGLTWVGVPLTEALYQGDVLIYNAALDEYRTMAEDSTYPFEYQWLNRHWIYWDSILCTAAICVFNGSCDDEFVRPWLHYRVWGNVDDLTLIFP